MSLLWPQLCDRSFRPRAAELARLHWRANLVMLGRPRACVAFAAISLVPLALLVAWLAAAGWFDDRIGSLVRPGFLVPTAVAYLALQHIAFTVAFERTYAPSFRRAMTEMGRPACEACGHLLAAASPRCPECGAAGPGALECAP